MRFIKLPIAMSAILLSQNLYAGQVVCSGKVEILSYHSPDSMMVKLSSMNTAVFFCSPDKTWTVAGTNYTTGPETCKVLYSTFMSAQLAGKTVESVYFDGDNTPASCNQFQDWSRFNIRHFNLK